MRQCARRCQNWACVGLPARVVVLWSSSGANLGVRCPRGEKVRERRGDGGGVASPSAALSTALGRIKVRPGSQPASQPTTTTATNVAAAQCAVMNSPWAFVFRRRVLPFKRVECTFGAVPMHLPKSARSSARPPASHTQYSGREPLAFMNARGICVFVRREGTRPRGPNGCADPTPPAI